MASNLARASASEHNVIELDRVRPSSSGLVSHSRNLCPDLCPDSSNDRRPRQAKKARKRELTPALIDNLRGGKLDDSKTGALSIEVLSSGKKRWLYRRRIAGRGEIVKLSLGLYPAYSIADAREWANALNLQIDAGIDPREAARQELRLATMTVDRAHDLYMEAVREGRSSRAKRPNKPRTVADKEEIYRRDIAPKIGRKIIYDVTEADLIKLVEAKGKTARVRANRLAAELKVFFGWTASLRGLAVGLEADPSRRLGDLRFPETPRARRLALQEIAWFLEALVEEEREYQRGMVLWLLTAARLAEVCEARSDELADGVWTIPAARTKNSVEHRISLGPWGWALMHSNSEWVFPAPKLDQPRSRSCWYKARDRVKKRMERLAGRPIERFTPHDFRRTSRSNTKRLKVDYETAEAMLNHVKKGLERTYDTYELEEEKRAWFLRWEQEIAEIARQAGVAEALGAPSRSSCGN
ncbi:integrase arm-type DNA-binding domain-containing protein [Sphingosinicella sp. CPCC 101087]|uniref:tyrosine-type recombinase/integrase n=1 Tax=Sphingosinicella sp. CPCC 101087 TaxID=2497754 RepID=UPI00101DA11E|nr:integrase arm-type DNA-binding domain-containing protein [Sphingosinicella sp. CPCC 101087]